MSRGNGGEPIFLEDEDFAEFTRLLQKARQRFRFELYAYCLMPNHFHLLLRQHIAAISQIMQWLLTCYAQTFNRWRSRRGHLFQGRFLSPACEDDRYLLGLRRYIHLNPARSRLVQKPEEWKWSGHEELKRPEKNGLLDVDFPLSLFHADKSIAAEEYERFLAKSANGGRTLDDGTDLADMGFIPNDVLVADASCQETASGPTESVAELAAQVCAERNLGLSAMRGNSKSRSLAQARRMLIQQAVERGIRPSEIAAFLNRVPSAVSNLLRDMYRHGT